MHYTRNRKPVTPFSAEEVNELNARVASMRERGYDVTLKFAPNDAHCNVVTWGNVSSRLTSKAEADVYLDGYEIGVLGERGQRARITPTKFTVFCSGKLYRLFRDDREFIHTELPAYSVERVLHVIDLVRGELPEVLLQFRL